MTPRATRARSGDLDFAAWHGEAVDVYPLLPSSSYHLIHSDGAYGIGGFEGDPTSARKLPDWYAPHLAAWDRLATPSSTLVFWGTPEGCARMLAPLEAAGWERNSRVVWAKGRGQADPAILRKWPEHFEEEAWIYTRETVDVAELAAGIETAPGDLVHRSVWEAAGADSRNAARAFLRAEWFERAGLTVRDATTAHNTGASHYFTRSQWQLPTLEGLTALYRAGAAEVPTDDDDGRPLLVLPEVWRAHVADRLEDDPSELDPTDLEAAELLRQTLELLRQRFDALRRSYEGVLEAYNAGRFAFELQRGARAVWTDAPVTPGRGRHSCAKRPDHVDRLVLTHSRPGERILEPFGGGCPTLTSARKLGRSCDTIERDPEWAAVAAGKLSAEHAVRRTSTRSQPSLWGS